MHGLLPPLVRVAHSRSFSTEGALVRALDASLVGSSEGALETGKQICSMSSEGNALGSMDTEGVVDGMADGTWDGFKDGDWEGSWEGSFDGSVDPDGC